MSSYKYWLEEQAEQEMIARAERETFQELNGFSDEENEFLSWNNQ